MYRENNNHKVTIVAHSMGASIMLHFLTQSGVITQAWKDQYIGNFIPIAGAWSGGNSALQFEISGLIVVNREPSDIFHPFCFFIDYFTNLSTPILRYIFLSSRPCHWSFNTNSALLLKHIFSPSPALCLEQYCPSFHSHPELHCFWLSATFL